MKDALDTNHKITKLITFSPRREAIFRANRQENDMLTDSSASVANYTILMNTWDEATRVARDMETKARILGVQSQMKKFSFMFGVYLAEGQNVAGMVVRTLEKLRSSEAFDLFWQQSLTVQKPMVLENQICLVHAAQVRKELNELGLKTDEEIKPELLEMLKSTRQGISNLLPLLQPNPKATLGLDQKGNIYCLREGDATAETGNTLPSIDSCNPPKNMWEGVEESHAEPGHQAIPESAIKLNPIHSEVTLVRETPPLMEKRVEDGTREESPEPTRISTATPTTTITPREVTPPQNPSGIIGGLLTRFLANQSKPKPLPPKGEETNALMQAGGYAARERQRLLLQTARGLAALHIPERKPWKNMDPEEEVNLFGLEEEE
ncbi:hypothetical protein EMCRGX_G008535 [Ephydatia muelleri]